jgi:hypothetical protein
MNKNIFFRFLVYSFTYIPFYFLITSESFIQKVGAVVGIFIIIIIASLPFKDEKKS